MLPRMTDADVPHVRRLRVEACGDICVRQSFAAQASDLNHVGVGQFSEVGFLALMWRLAMQHVEGVSLVLARRAVLQILRAVVVLVPVAVVDFVTVRSRADKCCGDQSVNEQMLTFAAKANTKVSALVFVWLQHLSFNAPDVAEVADFIRQFVAWDSAPLLGHRLIVTNYNTTGNM